MKNELELDVVAAVARAPTRLVRELPRRFQDSKTPKNVLFNMTLIALDDVIFKIEVHVLNGMWLPAVDFFRNSATVQITSPKRARHLDEYTQNVLEEETRYDDVRSRRPVALWCLHAVDATRLQE